MQNARLWGELFIDEESEVHFICHTKDDNFLATRTALRKFIALLQGKLDREQECPFYAAQEKMARESVALFAEHFGGGSDDQPEAR